MKDAEAEAQEIFKRLIVLPGSKISLANGVGNCSGPAYTPPCSFRNTPNGSWGIVQVLPPSNAATSLPKFPKTPIGN